MNTLVYNPNYLFPTTFDVEDTRERHLCALLANITANWGRIEYVFFLILEAIDPKQSVRWTQIFLAVKNPEVRVGRVMDEVATALKANQHSDFEQELKTAAELFEEIRIRRNLLAHGIWRRSSDEDRAVFEVLPLYIDKTTKNVPSAQVVDVNYIIRLDTDLRKLLQRIASLGTEMLAIQKLNEMERKTRRHEGK